MCELNAATLVPSYAFSVPAHSPLEVSASLFDERLSALVVQAGLPEGFGWDADDVFFRIVAKLELGLDSVFSFTFHDLFDARLA